MSRPAVRRARTSPSTLPVLLVLALTLPVVAVRAQDVAYVASLSDLDSASQVALGRVLTRAHEQGLPLEPLVAKVREGRLKRAAAPKIRAALERLSERLSLAREALGEHSSAEEVTAGADAIAAGAEPASLRAVRAATTESVTAAVGALAQLLASGVAEPKAMAMVIGLLRRNASPALLVALGNQVEADVATGLAPSASAAFRLRALEGELSGVSTTDASNLGNLTTTGNSNSAASSSPRRKP